MTFKQTVDVICNLPSMSHLTTPSNVTAFQWKDHCKSLDRMPTKIFKPFPTQQL